MADGSNARVTARPIPRPKTIRVLMVGNSLTYCARNRTISDLEKMAKRQSARYQLNGSPIIMKSWRIGRTRGIRTENGCTGKLRMENGIASYYRNRRMHP